jgi:type I restriction enzyme S subunit
MNYKLSEIALINPKESLPSGSLAKKVAMEKLQPFCRDIDGFELTKYNGGTKFRNGDTIMARITPCLENGKIAKVNILDEKEIGFGSTEYIIFRAKPGFTDEDYLYYLITSPIVRNPAIKSMVGSSGRQRVQTDVIQNLEIDVPELSIQKKIGSILKRIDDKIELNRKINDNLCEQIKATYKRIINGSNNLKVTRIGDLPIYVTDYVANGSFASLKENVTLYQEPNYAYFIRNTDLKSGNFDVYVDEHSYNFLSKSTLKGKEIIISNVGDVGSVFLCPKLNKPMTLGNNVIMIEPEDEKLRYYLYSLFKWFDGYNLIQGIKGGSAVPKFNKTDFKNIKINLPLEKELEEFNNFVSPYFEKLIQNQDANKRLSELRDSLLPKLMSGEIDVDSIEL